MLFEDMTQVIGGRIVVSTRTVALERKRCFCGVFFWARRRGHVYCGASCHRRAKHLRVRARKVA